MEAERLVTQFSNRYRMQPLPRPLRVFCLIEQGRFELKCHTVALASRHDPQR